MTISELIERLEALEIEVGEVDVFVDLEETYRAPLLEYDVIKHWIAL